MVIYLAHLRAVASLTLSVPFLLPLPHHFLHHRPPVLTTLELHAFAIFAALLPQLDPYPVAPWRLRMAAAAVEGKLLSQ